MWPVCKAKPATKNFYIMKNMYCVLLAVISISIGCITAPTNQSGMSFLPTEWKPANDVLCEGKGLRFGNCVARKMDDTTCIGIAKFNGSHVALKIPCSVMFESAIDTVMLE